MRFVGGVLLLLWWVLWGCMTISTSDISEKKEFIESVSNQALEELHAKIPETREYLADSFGYAVFSNQKNPYMEMSSHQGYGLVRDFVSQEKFYLGSYIDEHSRSACPMEPCRWVLIFKSGEFISALRQIKSKTMVVDLEKGLLGERALRLPASVSNFQPDIYVYLLSQGDVAEFPQGFLQMDLLNDSN